MRPERLFQILISEGAPSTSDSLERNVASLKATYPQADYRLYGNEELLDFLAGEFSAPVLNAYRAMTPFAFKADLARYCLLFKFGGLYSDLSYMHVRPIEFDGRCQLIVFRDVPGHPSWAVSNAIIYAEPESPVLHRAIERIVAHQQAGFYGCSPLDPTGPYMFGKVLAETEDWKTIRFGDSRLVSVDRTGRPNIIKLMPTGEVVAIRNKTVNGNITDLIASGGNDYNELWHGRRIWGESALTGQRLRAQRLMSRMRNK